MIQWNSLKSSLRTYIVHKRIKVKSVGIILGLNLFEEMIRVITPSDERLWRIGAMTNDGRPIGV